MASWESAPVVSAAPASGAKWQSAPVVSSQTSAPSPSGSNDMDLPVPDGQGGFDPRYQPSDRGTPAPTDNGYDDTYVAQGLSGVNEGIANAIGLPVDMANSVLRLGAAGINKATGASIQLPIDAFGGSGTVKAAIGEGIRPESDDPSKQFLRRIGAEVGSAVVPGLTIASKSATPFRLLGNELAAAAGSGTGAAIAEQVAPGNDLAEFGGQVAGGLSVGGIGRMLHGNAAGQFVKDAPTADQLQAMKNAAYNKVDTLGAEYSDQAYSGLTRAIQQDALAANISPTRHPKAYSLMEDLAGRQGPKTLTQLDQIRQEVSRDLLKSPDDAERFFGGQMMKKIDLFIDTATPSTVKGRPVDASGILGRQAAPDASGAINSARDLNTRYRKTEMLDNAEYKAENRAASTGSGGNVDNAMRQNIRGILDDPKKRRGFFPEEIEMMEQIVRGTPVQNVLRNVGKLSPQGNGLMAALGLGGTVVNPAMAAIPVAGIISKAIADGMTKNRINMLRALVASGRSAPKGLNLTAADRDVIAALAAAQTANQNDAITMTPRHGPIEVTVRGGQ